MKHVAKFFLALLVFGLIFISLVSRTMAHGTSEQLEKSVPGTNPVEQSQEGEVVGAIKLAKVYFVNVKDGDTVQQNLTLKFKVEGMKIRPAGQIEPGSGHFHVLIDTPIVQEGEILPENKNVMHFGKGQTEAKINLKPGKHKLVLQFADGAHRAFGPMLSHEIQVTVK